MRDQGKSPAPTGGERRLEESVQKAIRLLWEARLPDDPPREAPESDKDRQRP